MKQRQAALKEARKGKSCKRQKEMEVVMVSSADVHNDLVQDKSKKMVIIGTDVKSLYPNLTWASAGEEVYQAILDSDIEWEGCNWKEGVRYLALCRGYKWCKASPLRRVLPDRRFAHGSWPGVTGAGLLGPHSNDEDQWVFPNVELTELEKKTIMAEVMRLSVEVSFTTHVYPFKGAFFRQKDGGPIGLRSTCAIARVAMGSHSIQWRERMKENNVLVVVDGYYVDDGRVILCPLRPGWRWHSGGLWFCRQWELEDSILSPIEITKRAIGDSIDNIVDCLEFTVETEEDFPSGWLPTLDISLKVAEDNRVLYTFFRKTHCLKSMSPGRNSSLSEWDNPGIG